MKQPCLVLLLALGAAATVFAAPPGAPTTLTGSVTASTVTLTWTPPAGLPPSSYVVEAALAPGGAAIASLPVTATSLTVPNVPNGTYYVRVRALNADGASGPSNEIAVTVGGGGPCTAPPNPPTRLRADVDMSRVVITWAPAATGCPASSYILRAGTSHGTANIVQLPMSGTGLVANAPNGSFFVSVVAVNAFGTSAPSASVIITIVVPVPGGRVEFANSSLNIVSSPTGEAIVVGEVVNRSQQPATFVEVTASLRNAQNAVVGTRSTFLRGHPRRITSTGSIDDSALAPGELGCFYLRSGIPIASIVNASVAVTHDTLPSAAMAGKVNLLNPETSQPPAGIAVTAEASNDGSVPTFYNSPILYFQRTDGRAAGCDFTFVGGFSATLPVGVATDTILLPGQRVPFAFTSHAPSNAIVLRGWMQWQELSNDPLALLAAQTYDTMRRAADTDEGEQIAIAAWEALQIERRKLARPQP